MQSIGHEPFAVEAPDAGLDEALKAHEVIMASLQHILEEIREARPAASAAPGHRNRVLCA
jgi:hypothetical protein